MQELDDIDRSLMRQLQGDATLSVAQLAELTGLSQTPCARRLDRLERDGVIAGRDVVIDLAALGYDVEVSLRVTLDKTARLAFDEFIAGAKEVPEVTTIQTLLGRVDVRLTVIARDLTHYQEIYRERILALPHIADIEALMLVKTVKDNTSLPI